MRRIAILMCTLVLGCAVRPALPPVTVPEEEWSWTEPFHDTGAVVLLNEGLMTISGDSRSPVSTFEQHRVIRILSRRGMHHGDVTIPYDSDVRVDWIRAHTLTPDGKVHELDPKSVFDISSYPEFVFYSDQKAKRFTMPAMEPGAMLDIRYSLTLSGLTFWHAWSFEEGDAVLRSKFTLVKPENWKIRYRQYGIETEPWTGDNPEQTRTTMIWEAAKLPPLRPEIGMPPYREIGRWLSIAPVWIENWKDVCKWYLRLANLRMEPGPGVRSLAADLTSGLEDPKAKLKVLMEWVRDHIRYLAIEIGIGNFQPQYAETTLKNRHGDCKDTATLICSLAKAAGIRVIPVLVSTKINGIPDTTLASPLHFNHVIAAYLEPREDPVWMDATDPGVPFGSLPWYDEGLPVLPVDTSDVRLILTPVSEPEMNATKVNISGDLDSSGNGEFEAVLELTGAHASQFRTDLLSATGNGRRRMFESWLAQRFSKVDLDTFTVSSLEPVEDPLTVRIKFRCSELGSRINTGLFFSMESFSSDLSILVPKAKRRYPFRFAHGFTEEYIIDLGGEWTLREPEFSDSLLTGFGSALWSARRNGDRFVLTSRSRILGKDIPPGRYGDFHAFLSGIRKKNSGVLLIRKNGSEPGESIRSR